MTKRKLLLVALSLCMVAILAMGGTLAYLTDDAAETNTFTVGNVEIEIEEKMDLDGDGTWEEYEDEQKLSPIAQSKAPFNKLVETVNTGSEPAYIRTFITCPTELYWQLGYGFNGPKGITGSDGVTVAADVVNADGVITRHCLDKWTDIGKATINGVEVNIFMCENYDAVAAGSSVLSLTKVWVYENVGNEIDEEFEVKVYSEAIQSENLTYEEAMAALNNGKTDLEHAAELFNK